MFATTTTTKALEASYRVSLRITIREKPHTTREELILPAVKELAFLMIGEQTAKQRDCVPFSNNTVSRRIQDIAASVKDILVKRVRSSKHFA
jgi:hypothetical protein